MFQSCAVKLEPEDILGTHLALRDAQHAIAREHGFTGWRDMRDCVSEIQRHTPPQLVVDPVSYREDELVAVQLLKVEPLERPDGSKVAVVVLRSDLDQIIWMAVGEAEGMALAMGLKGQQIQRPLTHDLLTACLDLLKGVVLAVVVHALEQTTFLAHIVLDVAGERRYLDARPSDSLNVAARQHAPIYVSRNLMDSAAAPLSALPQILHHMCNTMPT